MIWRCFSTGICVSSSSYNARFHNIDHSFIGQHKPRSIILKDIQTYSNSNLSKKHKHFQLNIPPGVRAIGLLIMLVSPSARLFASKINNMKISIKCILKFQSDQIGTLRTKLRKLPLFKSIILALINIKHILFITCMYR